MAGELDFDDVPSPPAKVAPRAQPEPAAESFETAVAIVPANEPRSRKKPDALPASPEAEENLISCCLLDGADALAKCESAGIGARSFFEPRNATIFSAITAIWKRGDPIDAAVLHGELDRQKVLGAIGGMAYLLRVSSKQPTSALAMHFIEEVREMALRREMIREAAILTEQARDVGTPGQFEEVLAGAKERITALADNKPLRQKKDSVLDARAYDHAKKLSQPPAIFTLKGTTICTAGNLTSIFAQAKVGKSAQIGAILAATFARPEMLADTLGIEGRNYNEHAVLHFDTEQSPYDRQQLLVTALKRCGLAQPPAWLKSYSLTGLPAADCRDLIQHALSRAKKTFGGIYCCIIDGTADLVVNPNDPEECFPLVTQLQGYAIEYETALINVVHMNPASAQGQSEKGRGHLGSQLERKSESNLTMDKDAEGVTRIWGLKQRGKMIIKSEAAAFRWSDDKGMHVSCEATAEDAVKRGRPKTHTFAQFVQIFPTDPAKAEGRQALHKRAQDIADIADSSFRTLLTEAVNNGLIVRTQVGQFFKYHMAHAQSK